KTMRNRSARDISLGMYGLFCSGVALWLVYGWLTSAWPVIISNAVTLALSGTVLFLSVRSRRNFRRSSALSIAVLLCVGGAARAQTSNQWLLQGIRKLAASDYEGALPLLKSAQAAAPQAAVVEAWIAHGYHLQRRLDEAAAHYTRVLSL